MSIFSGIFKRKSPVENRTVGSNYSFYMGSSTAGKQVTERSAMQMTAVYSCVRILAEAVAGLPLHVYRYTDAGGKEKALDHPLYRLLHDEPNPEMSSFVFRETLMTHLLLWGNAYAQIIRNGKNEVIALYPLMPNKMTVDRDEKGQLYYTYQRSNEEAATMNGTSVTLNPSDVLHIPGLGFDGLVGYSPIAMAKNAIGMAIACEEYGAKFFANGAAPGGVLEHPGTIKDPQRVRESWQSTFGGSGNVDGYFRTPSAIEHMGYDLLVLDAVDCSLTLFTPTEYGNLIYEAMDLFKSGDYAGSEAAWRKVIALNGNYDLAYIGIGRALLRQQRYREAMDYFELKWDAENYSKAFQYYRKEWVEENILWIVIVLAVIIIVPLVVGKIKKIKWEIDTADIFKR